MDSMQQFTDKRTYDALKACVNGLSDLTTSASQCKDISSLDVIVNKFLELKAVARSTLGNTETALYHTDEIEQAKELLAKNIPSARQALLNQYSTINKSMSVFQLAFGWMSSISSKEKAPYDKLLEDKF